MNSYERSLIGMLYLSSRVFFSGFPALIRSTSSLPIITKADDVDYNVAARQQVTSVDSVSAETTAEQQLSSNRIGFVGPAGTCQSHSITTQRLSLYLTRLFNFKLPGRRELLILHATRARPLFPLQRSIAPEIETYHSLISYAKRSRMVNNSSVSNDESFTINCIWIWHL